MLNYQRVIIIYLKYWKLHFSSTLSYWLRPSVFLPVTVKSGSPVRHWWYWCFLHFVHTCCLQKLFWDRLAPPKIELEDNLGKTGSAFNYDKKQSLSDEPALFCHLKNGGQMVMMRTEAKAAIVVDAKRKWGFDGIGMDWDQEVPQAWHRMNFRPQFPAAA